MSKKTKKPEQPKAKKTLRVRKEVLRNLTPDDLGIVAGGIMCPFSHTPPP